MEGLPGWGAGAGREEGGASRRGGGGGGRKKEREAWLDSET